MRCPYCGGINQDDSTFCVNCGRDMRVPVSPRTPNGSVPGRPGRVSNQPVQGGRSAVPPLPGPPPIPPRVVSPPPVITNRYQGGVSPVQVVEVVYPEPPGPFPPSTMVQFEKLLSGAQEYKFVENELGDGRKKIVTITYQRCAHWQQAATLFKALREYQDKKFDVIVIRGIEPSQQNAYGFTNGQLEFDRNVHLGGKISNRYIVETDNGFTSGAVRFVLNE